MGLFSRKSSKEKRIKKFNKTEEKVIKLIDDLGLCPIFELFRHAMEEDQYRKTGEHFKKENVHPQQILEHVLSEYHQGPFRIASCRRV